MEAGELNLSATRRLALYLLLTRWARRGSPPPAHRAQALMRCTTTSAASLGRAGPECRPRDNGRRLIAPGPSCAATPHQGLPPRSSDRHSESLGSRGPDAARRVSSLISRLAEQSEIGHEIG
jgi:hypothetical protein